MFHPSRAGDKPSSKHRATGTFLINKSLRKINTGREFAGSIAFSCEKETVKTITAEKIKWAGTKSEWWGGESGSRRKSRQPERRQKDELEWERKGRSRGIYIRVYICRAAGGRATPS